MKRRIRCLFPAALLFAALLATHVGAIEIVSSTLPGDTELKLGDEVSFEVVVKGTTEQVDTT